MAIRNSETQEVSEINVNNLSVPSVATMVQHLLDTDPHPQYLVGSEFPAIVKSSITVGDLADVNFGLTIPEDGVMIYRSGIWTAATIPSIIDIDAKADKSVVYPHIAATDIHHTHSNKAELDKIKDGDVAAWSAVTASAHSHSNKSLLDSLTNAVTSSWDSAATWVNASSSALDNVHQASWNSAASWSGAHSASLEIVESSASAWNTRLDNVEATASANSASIASIETDYMKKDGSNSMIAATGLAFEGATAGTASAHVKYVAASNEFQFVFEK